MTKVYLSKQQHDPYEKFKILYISTDLDAAMEFTKNKVVTEDDSMLDFSIEVWENEKKYGYYYWDYCEKNFGYVSNT